MSTIPEAPQSRDELWLAKIAGEAVTPEEPQSRVEKWLAYIAENGIGGDPSDYHEGVDLTEKFASEIAAAPYSGNAWAWIKARITAGNFAGLLVGDYIPFAIGGNTYHAEIAGINTYKGSGDVEILDHIDFISRELYVSQHKYNPVKFNNGTKFGEEAATEFPWTASDAYLWLNALSGTVASEAAAGGGTGTAVDYTADGVYALLPSDLKAVIGEKRLYTEKRFNASSVRNVSSGNAWTDIGKLWLPNEGEIFGTVVRGTGISDAFQMIVQYPLFAGTEHRAKKRVGQSNRSTWSTMQAANNTSENVCNVHASGYAVPGAADTNVYYPICFRIERDHPVGLMGAQPDYANTSDEGE